MCGIYGYFGRSLDKTKTCRLMKNLAIETEIRGTHSTGYFATDDDYVYHCKDAKRAAEFVNEAHFSDLLHKDLHMFVGHNRWASVGEVVTKNAHPFVGKDFTLVHNGTMNEMDELIRKYRVVRQMEGTTDSEGLLRILDKGVEFEKILPQISGYSIVVYDAVTDKLFFARDRFPMVVTKIKALGIRVFASTKEILEKAVESTLGKKAARKLEILPTVRYILYEADWRSKSIKRTLEYTPVKPPKKQVRRRTLWNDPRTDRSGEYWSRRYDKWAGARVVYGN